MEKRPKASERKDGTWEAKGIDPTTGKRKSYYGSSSDDASERAAKSFRLGDNDRLAAFYLGSYVPTLKGRSQNWVNQVAWAMEKYVLPTFGETRLEDIDRKGAQAAFNNWSSKMKPSSLRRLRIVWSGVLNLAVDDEVIDRNPLTRIRMAETEDPEHVVLEPSQLWHLTTNCSNIIRPIVLLQGFVGLRRGEACATTWTHMKGGILGVRQQVLQPKGGAEITTKLKTRQSKRDVPLPPEMIEALASCQQSSRTYVCSNDSGGFLTPRAAYSILARESVRLGLPKMGTHDLRHTFTSLMENEFEAPRRVVDAILGRAGSGTTDSYSHTFRSQLGRWMQTYWERVSTSTTTERCRSSESVEGSTRTYGWRWCPGKDSNLHSLAGTST
jgi:integrase